MRINFLEKEDTDYCVEFLCFRPLLKLKGRSLKAWTLRTASSLCMHECLFYKAHASFSPPCEFTRFMHFFFLTTVRTYQTHVLLFSPPCELIKLMHSFFHRRANLSNSCTLFFTAVRTYQTHALFFSPPCELIKLMQSFFFTTVWTYQAHALFFSSPCELIRLMHSSSFFSPPCELIKLIHSFSDCWHSDLYPTHARTLWFYGTLWKEPGDTAATKTMWYRNLAWSTRLGKISNQINLYYFHQYAQHKYYHWRELLHFFYKTNTIFYKTLVATKMVLEAAPANDKKLQLNLLLPPPP